jgi:putative glutamine amidotransferase
VGVAPRKDVRMGVPIGISTSYRPDRDFGPVGPAQTYAGAVRAFGGEPFFFANDLATLAAQLATCGGVVFSGGCDVDPMHYGGARLPSVDAPDAARDAFEIALALAVRARGVPTLGICRGLQVVNVAFGGTLIEDLPSHFGARYSLHHQQVKEDGREREDYLPGHLVSVEPASAFARLAGAQAFVTNSLHHQAVRVLAPGLRAVASTSDGTLEALEAEFDHPFFVGVQWHPELLSPSDPVSASLFLALVRAAERQLTQAERLPR